jgi:hypothetical protein
MSEPCPFCGKPIVREYGSFRCKHCAGSSEDQIDQERKARVAEVRKLARDSGKGVGTTVAPVSPRASVAVVISEPPTSSKPMITKSRTRARPLGKPAVKSMAAGKRADAPAPAAGGPAKTKSARLRMVSAAAARIAERKKASPLDEAPPPIAPKRATRKER